MEEIKFSWIACDSLRDLTARILTLKGEEVYPIIETADADRWGYAEIDIGKSMVIPLGYADVGLAPRFILDGDHLLLGVADLVVGINVSKSTIEFRYQMPTMFHQFIRADENGFLLQDEIGFVLLSQSGEERWTFFRDLIQDCKLMGDELLVTTFEGERFRVKVGDDTAFSWK